MYDTILVPTDGSDHAEKAARHAIELAANLGASIHALYVVPESATYFLSMDLDFDEDEEHTAYGEQMTAEVAAMAEEHGVECTTAVTRGTVYMRIIDYAEDNDVDAIAMGTFGRAGIEDVLLGSTTEKVVRHSMIPVITIRTGKLERTMTD